MFLYPLILLLLLSPPALAQKEAKEVLPEQLKLQKIEQELQEKKSKLIETKKQEQQSLFQLFQIKTNLKQAKQKLNNANRKITVNEVQITKLRVEINEAAVLLQQKEAKLRRRVREIFKNSSVNYLDLLFSSRNMSDFINRSYFFSKLVESDVDLIDVINRKHRETTKKKETLQVVTSEIKDLAQTIAEKKQEITEQQKKEQEVLVSLKERREDYEKRIAMLEKSSEELTQIIQQKLAKQGKKVIVGGTGSIDWPLRGRITSRFGYRRHPLWGGRNMHTGLDIAAPSGTPIKAADGGEVILSKWWDGYGKAVVINHGKNIQTVYGHMSRIYAQEGTSVAKGQVIGLVGSTGYSTGPHLHFEVRENGKPKNPMNYLP
ncbi:hypothetical protein A2276_01220 [candidate division WOR-1 bacterium RIFOXYA12_FULL_43_27]|uniref:Uncharacterized protein n=1 Tax=candidate division WOR-1 bacterium RIFOXYC2_FULL_46_14 TaxID=1802587 RepID=A0A1F4U4T2_UNCSA|nr:MAG: hypothetical protein A2276_01220 [candidate division WOR-1 bacterium RIFOXYA12_FULL_43_27]OGC20694.1 MAG: hypothetical protein A2292_06655 [candidate division WOR-1 bacterium RIFOXYB2_FULL_46_45]OGC31569.1 MAG: hypothetical protein A2232_04795 [candidate division WOR-1 bacterium RIFOXYA2_FULL_46_56]OGC39975.1 MAG: hypothetical protein A2438_05640 [candidate division WOR-1 bacterium RIFOXYC2_FULL_46_14]